MNNKAQQMAQEARNKANADERDAIRELLNDIMTTALEGGIGYWAATRCVVRNTGGYIESFECQKSDEPSSEWFYVDGTLIELGMQRVLAPEFEVCRDILHAVFDAKRERDSSYIDVESADVIVQAALFNEIVFG
jgi:hypothetical protein